MRSSLGAKLVADEPGCPVGSPGNGGLIYASTCQFADFPSRKPGEDIPELSGMIRSFDEYTHVIVANMSVFEKIFGRASGSSQ